MPLHSPRPSEISWGRAFGGNGVREVERSAHRLIIGFGQRRLIGDQPELVERVEAAEGGGSACAPAG